MSHATETARKMLPKGARKDGRVEINARLLHDLIVEAEVGEMMSKSEPPLLFGSLLHSGTKNYE